MKVVCGTRTFETKKAFEQYVRKLIYERIGVCRSVSKKSLVLFNELQTLLIRHPTVQKNIGDVDDYAVQRNRMNKSALQTVVYLRTDGSSRRKTLTISWRNAMDKKVPTAAQGLESAMRSAVDRQIRQFRKRTREKACALCGTTEQLEVDHVVEFVQLKTRFLKTSKQEAPTTFGYKRRTLRKQFLKMDKPFQYAWSRFHKKHAELRLLCKPCNLARNKKVPASQKLKTKSMNKPVKTRPKIEVASLRHLPSPSSERKQLSVGRYDQTPSPEYRFSAVAFAAAFRIQQWFREKCR